MAGQTMTMKVEGMNELIADLTVLSQMYPQKSASLLRAEARGIRREVATKVKDLKQSATNVDTLPLTKMGSYEISRVKDYRVAQYIEIKAKSPHFHLVEHGHQLVKNGKNIGFVQGYHMMDNTVKEYKGKIPERVNYMVDELLKEGGFKG